MTTTNVCAAAASSPTNNSLVGEGDEAMRRVQLHSPRHADAMDTTDLVLFWPVVNGLPEVGTLYTL